MIAELATARASGFVYMLRRPSVLLSQHMAKTKETAKARDEEVKAEKERKVCVSRHALRLSKLNGASKPTGMPSIYTAATTVALQEPDGG